MSTKKISIEVGHGGSDSGAVSGSILEKNINLAVALELNRQLMRHGITTLISRTADVNDRAADFLPKAQAFKPDVGISIHTNALNRTARGFEVYRNTNSFKAQSNALCAAIETEVKALGQSSRGVKDSPFLMSSLSCPTAYLELGFLDNPADYAQFDTELKQKRFAVAYTKGVLKFLDIAWKEETSKCEHKAGCDEIITKPKCEKNGSVEAKCRACNAIIGGNSIKATGHKFGEWFSAHKNAERDIQIRVCTVCGKTEQQTVYAPSAPESPAEISMWRVVAGSFTDKENAENRVENLKKAGFESFIYSTKI